VSCSIEDLARYAAEHLAGLKGRGRLLKQESYERLHITWNEQPDGFTLGWGLRSDPNYGVVHYGAGSGGTFFVRIWIAPETNIAIVTATNAGTGADATKQIIEQLAKRFRD
jgi:CubicO group peptidase (beta-lactamase class C family)